MIVKLGWEALLIVTANLWILALSADVHFSANTSQLVKGQTVELQCAAPQFAFLDIIRIVKQVRLGMRFEHLTVSTLGHVVKAFSQTGRYQSRFDGKSKRVYLTIANVEAEDSGDYGCQWIRHSLRSQTFITITVYTPPKRVSLQSEHCWTSPPEPEQAGAAGVNRSEVVVVEGGRAMLACCADLEGLKEQPRLDFTVDGRSVKRSRWFHFYQTGPIIKTKNKKRTVTNKLMMAFRPIHVTRRYTGQRLSCSIKVPGVPVVNRTASIRVHYKPAIRCQSTVPASLGTRQFKLVCRGSMSPGPSGWAWKRFDQEGVQPTRKGTTITSKEIQPEEYEFVLEFDELTRSDFGHYRLGVNNSVGQVQRDISLEPLDPGGPQHSRQQQNPPADSSRATRGSTNSGQMALVVSLLAALIQPRA